MELQRIKGKRLGRLRLETPPHLDPKFVHLGDYIDPEWEKWLRQEPKGRAKVAMPTLRAYRDWWPFIAPKLPNGPGMMLNNVLATDTVAAVGHAIQIITGVDGTIVTPTDQDILTMYEASGYVPTDPANPTTNASDQGWTIPAALEYWRTVGLAGHQNQGYVAINPYNYIHVDLALEVFGFVNVGLYLPTYAQKQNLLWSVPTWGLGGIGEPGSWGGHSVLVHKRCETPMYRHSAITWGTPEWHITPNAWKAYVDECWTAYSTDWVHLSGLAPSGLNMTQLLADLALFAQQPSPLSWKPFLN